ncbi:hypothetical protein NL676_013469 [Syzygium grande]|nr:hypothetical protein NL676_013469 [Syzygium grande]
MAIPPISIVAPPPQWEAARAFFVFKVSLGDSGNNYFLTTTVRVDCLLYGIYYLTHQPTGHFSNGLDLPDISAPPPQAEVARDFFVFRDSLGYSGNSYFFATTAHVNSLPYGIDYPAHQPTGRFSNGLDLPGIIGKSISSTLQLLLHASRFV